uniref:Protein kinase domain-containing protein n=1 Tax=Macrostomum lignano TaxID=282301 RepID=A0A1I8J5B6_9PLAT
MNRENQLSILFFALLAGVTGRLVSLFYLGCYVDKEARRDINGLRNLISIGSFRVTSCNCVSNGREMSPEFCAAICALNGFVYFGLQYSKECFCGNSYGSYGKANESDCSLKCSGNSNKICGGYYRNSVFALTFTADYVLRGDYNQVRQLATHNLVTKVDSDLVVFMELLDGQTLERFINHRPLNELKIRDFSKQICSALLYMHNRRPPVIHRDINCSNIIICADNITIKLIDFGLSIKLEQSVSHISASTQSPKGTLNFMAPELLGAGESDSVQYSRESDIWAFGCSVFQMASGARPFRGNQSIYQVALRIANSGLGNNTYTVVRQSSTPVTSDSTSAWPAAAQSDADCLLQCSARADCQAAVFSKRLLACHLLAFAYPPASLTGPDWTLYQRG